MIPVTKSYIPPLSEYMSYVKRAFENGWLTNRGELIEELENEIQSYLNSKTKPLLVSNGTIALQIAIKALELKGDIITTPFSYVATTSSIVWEGCNPVFVDIHPEYLTIDETLIESAITEKTSAILATHVYGNPCNVEAIDKIAKKYNLKVVYDAAHCFGVSFKGKSIFDYGDISTCSFHATKIFHTGEGGAIFCNNLNYNDKIFNYHNFGHEDNISFNGLGINGKMSEINAALGLSILKYINEIKRDRSRLVEFYNEKIHNPNINKIKIRKETEWNFAYYPVIFSSERELLIAEKEMNTKKIFPRRYFYPSLNKLPYLKRKPSPISEDISKRILCLPLYFGLNENQIKSISSII